LNRDRHEYFPLGLRCSHCGDWRPLEGAIAHIERFHDSCLSCSAERLLCRALLEDEQVAAEIVVQRQLEGSWPS